MVFGDLSTYMVSSKDEAIYGRSRIQWGFPALSLQGRWSSLPIWLASRQGYIDKLSIKSKLSKRGSIIIFWPRNHLKGCNRNLFCWGLGSILCPWSCEPRETIGEEVHWHDLETPTIDADPRIQHGTCSKPLGEVDQWLSSSGTLWRCVGVASYQLVLWFFI